MGGASSRNYPPGKGIILRNNGGIFTCYVQKLPGLYTLQDFHTPDSTEKKAPAPDEQGAGQGTDGGEQGGWDRSIRVEIRGEALRIVDVLGANQSGWTPLHSCCHDKQSQAAGLVILEEYVRRDGDLNAKTRVGPGTFNKGWSPLHIAAAYGLEDLVRSLVKHGADVNTRNSFDWSPINEAVQRNFVGCVEALISGGCDLNRIPNNELSDTAPIFRPPCQSPLGEAARCGHADLIKLLAKAGADVNSVNHAGWTPLHEAGFYNRGLCIRILLAFGADPMVENRLGSTPFQVCTGSDARKALQELAPEEACRPSKLSFGTSNDTEAAAKEDRGARHTGHDAQGEKADREPREPRAPSSEPCSAASRRDAARAAEKEKGSMLNTGGLLGDLPQLVQQRQHADTGLSARAEIKSRVPSSSKAAAAASASSTADESVPAKYRCALSGQLLQEPWRTPYGHVFEHSTILAWLESCGSVCPVTGGPLAKDEMKADCELQDEIHQWQMDAACGKRCAEVEGGSLEGDAVYDFY
ncbi:unnamed protein product [Chrysoparadoxa australica]